MVFFVGAVDADVINCMREAFHFFDLAKKVTCQQFCASFLCGQAQKTQLKQPNMQAIAMELDSFQLLWSFI